MSNTQGNEDTLAVPDELTTLKARADTLGVTYHPTIGVDKLREKVAAAIAGTPEPKNTEVVEVPEVVVETIEQRRMRKRKEANALMRVNVSCMNPAKKEWDGELITAGNTLVGSFSKFVPFNTEDGWHIPHIIYEQIKDRQCQIFVTVKDARGNSSRKGKLIKEFAIEVLPTLTADELSELARRQAASNSTV